MKAGLALSGLFSGLFVWFALASGGNAYPAEPDFPVAPEAFVDGRFSQAEGIDFNGEGRLFVTADKAFWEILPDGSVRELASLHSNLGVTAYGERDLLVADFGPTNAFRHDRNSDGIVWRISPGGQKDVFATGMGDPNFIAIRSDGAVLVSDDATADIYIIGPEDRTPKLYSTAVNHPNGMVFNADESLLYVAQIFKSVRPVVSDNTVWAIPLKDGKPVRGARLVTRTDPDAANDGLAIDGEGRIYIAANRSGRIWRFDPESEAMTLIAEDMPGAASLAFGAGAFDHDAIYVTSTQTGTIWKVRYRLDKMPPADNGPAR